MVQNIFFKGVPAGILAIILLFSGIQSVRATASVDPNAAEHASNSTPGKMEEAVLAPAFIFGKEQKHTIVKDETLPELAWKYNVGFVELQAANPEMDAWLPKEGEEITIPTRIVLPDAPHEGIVVNLGEMRLYYFETSGKAPLSYPIGIGREGLNTPSLSSTVSRKVEGPTWRPTPRMRQLDPSLPEVFPPGEDNPLGTHALYIGTTEYRIHGTAKPLGVGRRVSSGCIRMYPENIITMYNKTAVGTKVTIVNQPIKMAWNKDVLYLEAHPSAKQADEIEFSGKLSSFEWPEGLIEKIRSESKGKNKKIDWKKVRQVVTQRRGVPVAVSF